MKRRCVYFVLLILIIVIQSCNKIEPPYIENNGNIVHGQHTQKILIEDYTGHNCPNCPNAANIADDIKKLYGDKIILLTVHAGWFANPACSVTGGFAPIDFRNTAGNELDTYFSISTTGVPNGMINRIKIGDSPIINPSSWSSIVDTIVNNPSDVRIKILNVYNTSTRNIASSLEIEFFKTLNGIYKLCVYLKEDSIVSWQQNNDNTIGTIPVISNYIHKNILRGSMNGTFGDTLVSGTVAIGKIFNKNINYSLNANWNDAHCLVVAFLYDAISNKIIQVEEKKIIGN